MDRFNVIDQFDLNLFVINIYSFVPSLISDKRHLSKSSLSFVIKVHSLSSALYPNFIFVNEIHVIFIFSLYLMNMFTT